MNKNMLFLSMCRKDSALIPFMLARMAPSMMGPTQCEEDYLVTRYITLETRPLTVLQEMLCWIFYKSCYYSKNDYGRVSAFFSCKDVTFDFCITKKNPDTDECVTRPFLEHFFTSTPRYRSYSTRREVSLVVNLFIVHGIEPHMYLSPDEHSALIKGFEAYMTSKHVGKSARK